MVINQSLARKWEKERVPLDRCSATAEVFKCTGMRFVTGSHEQIWQSLTINSPRANYEKRCVYQSTRKTSGEITRTLKTELNQADAVSSSLQFIGFLLQMKNIIGEH